MNTTFNQKRKPTAGRYFVIRALKREGHTRAGAISIARQRIACGGQGHFHVLLVVHVTAVVRLKRVPVITVEEVKNSKSRRKRMVR